MAFDTDFLQLMTQSIVVYDHVSHDGYGEPTYSTSGTTYSAHISEKPELVRNQFGQEVVSTHTAWLASTTTALKATSKYVFPDGTEPNLVSLQRLYDEDGIHHHKVVFGSGAGG